jgi:hypothetical protein
MLTDAQFEQVERWLIELFQFDLCGWLRAKGLVDYNGEFCL